MTNNAHDTIAAVLAPLREEDFLRSHWGRRFFYQPGDAGRFAAFLNWAEVSAVVANHPWPSPRMKLLLEDAEVTPDAGAPERTSVDSLLQHGTLFCVQSAEERFERLRRVAADFAYAFRERVTASVCASYEYARASKPRWDDHEAFVLQVSGRKFWRVYSPTKHSPLLPGSPDEPLPDGEPIWQGEVAEGGLLYLPRGYWYASEGMESPSLHATIAVDCATGLDLVAWLVRGLGESTTFREDLPRLATPAKQREHARKLSIELKALLDESMLERFFKADDRDAPALSGFSGLTGGTNATVLRWLAPRPVTIAVEEGLGRFLEFECLGREWHLPRWTEQVLRVIVEHREIRRQALQEALSAGLSAGDVDQAVALLLRHGLVAEAAVTG